MSIDSYLLAISKRNSLLSALNHAQHLHRLQQTMKTWNACLEARDWLAKIRQGTAVLNAAKASGPAVGITCLRAFRTDPPFIVAPFSWPRPCRVQRRHYGSATLTVPNKNPSERIRKCIAAEPGCSRISVPFPPPSSSSD